jgi:hypothetical protein
MCAGDICRPHNTQQTDLHLLGTAPPMPPPPLFAVPPRAASYSRLRPEGLRGLRGGPARTTRTRSPTSVVSENRHEQASISRIPQDRMHACAPYTHSNAFSKTSLHAGHAVQSKKCIGHRPTCSCEVLASSRPLHLRAASAHTRKGERMAASVTSLPQYVVG